MNPSPRALTAFALGLVLFAAPPVLRAGSHSHEAEPASGRWILDFDPDALARLIEDLFGGWKSRAPYARIPARYFERAPLEETVPTPDKANAVLRAGMTFVEGMLDLVPTARVAHIGLYREPETFVAVEYFFKAPADIAERLVVVVAPVLATANTAVAAIDRGTLTRALQAAGEVQLPLRSAYSSLYSIPAPSTGTL